MIPANLTPGTVYKYTPLGGVPTLLKYWYEQLNYWSFTTVDEPQSIVLLHSVQIINNITEIN